jgi:ParB-like chromosome segregation protein Spo0J
MADKAPAWPADKVERRRVSELVPYARNARRHSAKQVAQLAKSIEQWGWTVPVLVDGAGEIIAGHARVMAAKKLGIESVPVMVATGWSDEQRRAYVLADNQLALNSEWDKDLLGLELEGLTEAGFDVALAGFEPDGEAAEEGSPELEDVGIARRFWISVQGPLEAQAEALHTLKELAKVSGIEVQSNLVG